MLSGSCQKRYWVDARDCPLDAFLTYALSDLTIIRDMGGVKEPEFTVVISGSVLETAVPVIL